MTDRLSIDELLDGALVPTAPASGVDIGEALRRLAADASGARPSPHIERAATAAQRLAVVCRWSINSAGAAEHLRRLAAEHPAAPVREEQLDVQGAAVFACLLSLTGHPLSAEFWWGLAAGAGHALSAYCLHLHHGALGEVREAAHWRVEFTRAVDDAGVDIIDYLARLEALASYVRRHGSDTSTGPTARLEMEVARLAAGPSLIARRPDQRLADRLLEFTRRA
ncbi:hypothetical protein [Streptomyces yaizuensis]|uniref:Uncharacterized protein n=1 Tax=Streptomyces yaizuensis TaxID=2989713 RepID=A0ABQ5P668_9ACTN|nr:hypothetical protein [Streptomyces sp. YSPA8]GLF98088.1 hypothetical protein SYYSPA8_27345 [Streptomyces sp. YSPA8]